MERLFIPGGPGQRPEVRPDDTDAQRLRRLFMRAESVALAGADPVTGDGPRRLAEFLANQGFRLIEAGAAEARDILVVLGPEALDAAIAAAARAGAGTLWVEPAAAAGTAPDAVRARLPEGVELVWGRSIRDEYAGQFLSTCSA